MATKRGVPKRDGSGKGRGLNKGRGGCKNPTEKNQVRRNSKRSR